MFEVDQILVQSGEIQIESINGEVLREDSFIFYINTVEKYVGVDSLSDNILTLFVDEDTRRYGELIGTASNPKETGIQFPDGWIVSATPGRYSIRVIGVLRSNEKGSVRNVPFFQVG